MRAIGSTVAAPALGEVENVRSKRAQVKSGATNGADCYLKRWI
jgi:hypothetical protein